ncbi:hypothetical protein QQ045_030230 [Rhodiola kirilowii]
MSTKKVKGLLKGLRYISKVFDDEQEEPEMQIGYPTDVKHVAHIGWDGPDDNNNNKGPTWMNDFKPNADDDSSPRPDGHIGDEAKGTKQGIFFSFYSTLYLTKQKSRFWPIKVTKEHLVNQSYMLIRGVTKW